MTVNKYTERTIEKFITTDKPSKIGMWFEGKFYKGWADQSKSRMGVKYNRLIRLNARLNARVS